MSEFYKRSTDYDLADKYLKDGHRLAVYFTNDLYVLENPDGLSGETLDYYKEANAEFLLPTADPAITLRDSLENAIKDRTNMKQLNDELREKLNNSGIEVLECALSDAHREIRDRDTRIEELLDENERQEKLLKDLQISVNNDDQAQTIRLLQIQIEGWRAMMEGANESCDELRAKLKKCKASQIESKDQEIRIAKNDIKNLDREIQILQEKLELAASIHQVQIERRDIALQAQIQTINGLRTLEGNLTRSNTDRLSELTAIMRMVQALEETPQDKREGAIYLIKRVLYEQICKLDPSQSVSL